MNKHNRRLSVCYWETLPSHRNHRTMVQDIKNTTTVCKSLVVLFFAETAFVWYFIQYCMRFHRNPRLVAVVNVPFQPYTIPSPIRITPYPPVIVCRSFVVAWRKHIGTNPVHELPYPLDGHHGASRFKTHTPHQTVSCLVGSVAHAAPALGFHIGQDRC